MNLKKFFTISACLMLAVNCFIPAEVQAVTKNEAIDFYNGLCTATNEFNVSEIKKYLDCSENDVIEIFKISGVPYPKTQAYFRIAMGLQAIGSLESAYEYYSKAISCTKNIKNMDSKFKSNIFIWRGYCNFVMMKNSNNFNETNVKKMFDDFEISLRNDANNGENYALLGEIYYTLGDYETALKFLQTAEPLCENYETKKRIQESIEYVKATIDDNKPGMIDWAKEHFSDIVKGGAILLGIAKVGLAFFGGGGGDSADYQYQE